MTRMISVLVLFTVAGACQTPSGAASSASTDPASVQVPASVDDSAARRQRLRANILAHYPPLADLDPQIGTFNKLNTEMDQVEMLLQTPRGEQRQKILISRDNSQAFLVLDGPIDVSRSTEQIATEQREKQARVVAGLKDTVAAWPVRGPPDARVTLVEFSDFQCPYCERAYRTVEEVLTRYPKKVRLVFVPYPLPFHDWARDASVYTACVASVDSQAYWKLYDGFFLAQKDITQENLVERSELLLQGSEPALAALRACSGEPKGEARAKAEASVDAAMKIGAEHGVEGTPGFFVNGIFLGGAQPMDAFVQAIEQALADSSPPS